MLELHELESQDGSQGPQYVVKMYRRDGETKHEEPLVLDSKCDLFNSFADTFKKSKCDLFNSFADTFKKYAEATWGEKLA